MAFVAVLNSDNLATASFSTLAITDASTYDTLDVADFTSRKLTITDKDGETPGGYDAEILWPFVDGLGDVKEIEFPLDMAFTLSLIYVPVVADAAATFTKTITTIFSGNAKSLHSSRVTKSEISDTVRPASKPQYRATTTILSNMIDSAEYEASVGNLESAQNLLDQANTMDTDTINF